MQDCHSEPVEGRFKVCFRRFDRLSVTVLVLIDLARFISFQLPLR